MKAIHLVTLIGTVFFSTFAVCEAQTNTSSHPAAPLPNPPAAANGTLSPAEWQELREARMAAVKANPSLLTKATELNQKLRQFEAKLDAAMVKTDPNIARVLAKFASNRPVAVHPPVAPSEPKTP